ncbi:proteasome assembly chaperone 3, partial [Tanacetum coccineum]
ESKIDIVITSYEDQFMERAGWVLNHITYLLNVLLHNYLGKRDESACFTKTDATKQSYSLPIIVWAGALINSGFQTIDYYFPTGLKDIPCNSGSSKPLTLSLGLKDHSMETLKGIVSAVIEHKLW